MTDTEDRAGDAGGVGADRWVGERVGKAWASQPLVTDSAAQIIRDLLAGKISERSLRGGELAETAKSLLGAMTPPATPEPADDHAHPDDRADVV